MFTFSTFLHVAVWSWPVTKGQAVALLPFPLLGWGGEWKFSGSLWYGGVSSAHVMSSSGKSLKSLPSGQSMITSRIPGRLGFPTWARWVISATHLLHVASVAWCVERTLSLNIQPRTSNRGARRSCASVPTTSETARTPSYAARISRLVSWRCREPEEVHNLPE